MQAPGFVIGVAFDGVQRVGLVALAAQEQAAGRGNLRKQRLSQRKIATNKEELLPVKGFLKPLQIKIGEQPPAPGAMRNLMSFLRDEAKLDVVVGVDQLSPNDEDLFKHKFLYMHGKKSFEFDAQEIDNIKANLQSGGLLFADACCGQAEFDKAFRKFAEKMFPQNKLEPIPVVLNEAIELARRYGSKDSPAFVNGILDKIAKGRPAELAKVEA